MHIENFNDHLKALETYKLGLGRNYCNSLLLERMSNIYINHLEKEEMGELCLEIARRLNPTYSIPINELANYYHEKKDYLKSLPLFYECALNDP